MEVEINLHTSVENGSANQILSSDDDSSAPVVKTKKRVQRFSESDSDDIGDSNKVGNNQAATPESSDSDDYTSILKSIPNRSRLRSVSDDSDLETNGKPNSLNSTAQTKKPSKSIVDSDSETANEFVKANKNEEQQMRMNNKKNKMKDKFKKLLNSRDRNMEMEKRHSDNSSKENTENDGGCGTDDEILSINKIKKKIKETSTSIKMSICDPDTSDEENTLSKLIQKPKKQQRRALVTSPKPLRMSAKQAMENMQKIKSESNRMLREKEVSLPYHRPKALSLKDIMSRRKPAVSSDGKALPIKMNEEQLRQYALSLEQRQKEMMELCKSDTEDDEPEESKEILQDPAVSTSDNIDKVEQLSESIAEFNYTSKVEAAEECVTTSNAKQDTVTSTAGSVINLMETTEVAVNKPDQDKVSNINSPDLIHNDEKPLESGDNLCDKSGDMSAEMELVYNDSVEESHGEVEHNNTSAEISTKTDELQSVSDNHVAEVHDTLPHVTDKLNDEIISENTCCTEKDSQLISLQYDSERYESKTQEVTNESNPMNIPEDTSYSSQLLNPVDQEADFPDDDIEMDDINMEDIDSIIENAEIIKNADSDKYINSPSLVKDSPLNIKPKLTGGPGMVIDLDGSDPIAPKKLTGVELLKERFTFFAKLKTPEEAEREREKRQKPGTLHLKLKQELEDQIAEQRSIEWAKRLEGEKLQQKEEDTIRGDNESDAEDDIDKIEAKLNEKDVDDKESSEESEEEELVEDDVLIEDKPRKKNPLLADEAEESDGDNAEANNEMNEEGENDIDENDEANKDSSSEDEESSESEEEQESKPKKGRILKAFEDSDDEENTVMTGKDPGLAPGSNIISIKDNLSNKQVNIDESLEKTVGTQNYTEIVENEDSRIQNNNSPLNIDIHKLGNTITDTQDDDLQLAQLPKTSSEDIFASQSSQNDTQSSNSKKVKDDDVGDLGTQTFSLMTSVNTTTNLDFDEPDKLTVISETQPYDDNLEAVVGLCSGSFSQNYIEIKPPSTQSQVSQSQAIGEDLLDMCTGKFYDNQFISQPEENVLDTSDDISQELSINTPNFENTDNHKTVPIKTVENNKDSQLESLEKESRRKAEGDILKSVLDELNEPDFESLKPLKFFFDGKSQKDNKANVSNTQLKKKFIIDSDEETANVTEVNDQKKKKKLKKKKPEKRALQISDDEDDMSEQEEADFMSENEEGNENEEERLVEYDSEENEVEVKPIQAKKKRKVTDFFEQEAELTSEDEWAGSGDEDEAGLDRMEREAGDDETFHQGRLQRELGQIHMRDVLDQDKREVRIIQELLFEDGDLGGGGRQRKFRWRNADGEEETGTVPDEFTGTQEEEFESEEQWRKQRHEREVFLKQLQEKDGNEDLNTSVNRTTIIKANLTSRTMSSILEEANNKTTVENNKSTVLPEKKTDITSPKKPFTIFQHNYHGSLLTRGRGALARLAALATPLVADDEAPRGLRAPAANRNFVFATLTPEPAEHKAPKRKADTNIGTPKLVKKMKREDKPRQSKISLLDHLKI